MTVRRPNLFIVGAPKCGTTAWVSYLSGHSDIFFSPAKEPHFFCEDFPRFRWAKSLEEYEELFAGAKAEKIVCEASVQYLFSSVAAHNINAYNPDARILVFLRQQSSFLPSYHHQLLYNRDETIADFETAWRLAPGSGKREIPPTCREPTFLDYPKVGRFSEQLERYADLFPAENIKVIWFDDWTKNARNTYADILDFLELPDDGRTDFAVVHNAKFHRSQLIGNLTQRPPGWLLKVSRIVKRLTGRQKLQAAQILRQINSAQGYSNKVSAELKQEIDDYFADDNAALTALLARIA